MNTRRSTALPGECAKASYQTRREAELALAPDAQRVVEGTVVGEAAKPYRCGYCGAWHLSVRRTA